MAIPHNIQPNDGMTQDPLTNIASSIHRRRRTHRKFQCPVVKSHKAREKPDSIVCNLFSLIFRKGKTFWSIGFLITRNIQVHHTSCLNENIITPCRLLSHPNYLRRKHIRPGQNEYTKLKFTYKSNLLSNRIIQYSLANCIKMMNKLCLKI